MRDRRTNWILYLALISCLAIYVGCQSETRISQPTSEAGQCRVTPGSIDFGSIIIGTAVLDTLHLRNVGSGQIRGRIEPDCDDIAILGSAEYNLAGGNRAELLVQFLPTTPGSLSCFLDGGVGCAPVAVHGVALRPAACSLSAEEVDYGEVPLGEAKELTVVLINTGDAPLESHASLDCLSYQLVTGGGAFSLATSEAREFRVRFEPKSRASHSCLLVLDGCNTEVPLFGRGILAPKCSVSANSVDFGVVEQGGVRKTTASIENVGEGTLLGNLGFEGECRGYEFTSGEGEFALRAGESRQFGIRYTAGEPGVTRCAVLTGAECPDIEFKATADAGAVCSVSPMSLDFPATELGEAVLDTIEITNSGGSILRGLAELSSACRSLALVEGYEAFELPAGESHRVVVRFNPLVEGSVSCGLLLGTAKCEDVTIVATGAEAAACSIDREEFDLGSVEIGTFVDDSFVIENTGGLPLSGEVIFNENCEGMRFLEGSEEYLLLPDQQHTVRFRYEPTASSSLQCEILLGENCDAVSVTGTSHLPPVCSVSSTSLQFGAVPLGSFLDRSVTVQNSGEGTLTGDIELVGADFTLPEGSGSFSLDAGASREIRVRYQPTETSVGSASLVLGSSCTPVACAGSGVLPADCSISSEEIDFGLVTVGDSQSRTVEVTNLGGSSLAGEILLPSCSDIAIVSGGGVFELEPAESFTVTLLYSPTTSGNISCEMTIGSSCASVQLIGSAQLPASCQIGNAPDFGTVTIGSTVEGIVTLSNEGEAPLEGDISLLGEECESFSLLDGAGSYTIPGGTSSDFGIGFTPTASGLVQCTLDLGTHCPTVLLQGIGEGAALCSIDDNVLDFEVSRSGETAVESTTLRNLGEGTLFGTVSLLDSPGFSIRSGAGDYSLSANQSRTLIVEFSGKEPGTYNGAVTFGPDCSDLILQAEVEAFATCTLTPDELNFGSIEIGSPAERSFVIENNGGGELSGTVTLGTSCSEFDILSGSGSFLLTAGEIHSVVVRFAPSSEGTALCSIELGTDLDDCGPVNATGEATAAPVCELSPSSLDFGIVPVTASGSNAVDRTFAVENTGGGILEGTISESCSHYSIISGGGSYALESGEVQEVTVRYRPTALGNHNCDVSVGSGCEVSCLGTGGYSYANHIASRVAACLECHSTSFDDYDNVLAVIDLGTPLNSLLLRKAANVVSHSGGERDGWEWLTGSDHIATRNWIEEGAAP